MAENIPFAYKISDGLLQWHFPRLNGGGLAQELPAECWRYRTDHTAGSCSWRAFTEQALLLDANWNCIIDFAPVQCEGVLVNGDSMGGCHILTATTPRQEFSSSSILLLKTKREFVLLESVAGIPGEFFWRGIWENGSINNLTFEVSERFAQSGKLPEISVVISRGNNPHRLLEDWLKRHYPVRKNMPAAVAAWSSWDYYRWSITAEDVLANAEFIARDPILSKHIKRIIIDDGWMNCYGEWEPNSRFADMPGLVRELKKMNFSAGLWFAPSIAEPQSMIAQKNWQWLACSENGWPCMAFECMSRRGFLLDPTRGEVQKYMGELFSHYKNMGFDYFKLDFLKHTLNARKFYDRHATANDIMRELVRPIREAVGKDTILMGCNYLFSAGNEYLDIVRCASDIHANYDSIKQNSVSIAARSAMHNKIWNNDPDFALVRGRETSDDPDIDLLRPNQVYVQATADKFDDFLGQWSCAGQMTGTEAEILLSLVLISGGELTFSDALFKLNANGILLVRKAAAAPRGHSGIADDLLQREYPRRFTQKVNSKHWRKLWINWQSEPATVQLDGLPEKSVRIEDFWRETDLTASKTIILPGHSCLLTDIFCS